MTADEENRLLQVANDKLEDAAAALQRFPTNRTVASSLLRSGIELEVRHAMAAIRDIRQARGQYPGSITCPVCKRVSYNPHDVRERYCGHCHRFHDGIVAGPRGGA